jgi:hypothetical protein
MDGIGREALGLRSSREQLNKSRTKKPAILVPSRSHQQYIDSLKLLQILDGCIYRNMLMLKGNLYVKSLTKGVL